MWLLTITMVYFWSENKKWNAYFLTAQALIILLHRKIFWNACILHVLHACMLREYNTGGTYLTNPKINFKNEKDVKFSTKKIGEAFVADSEFSYFEKHYKENMMYDYNCNVKKGCLSLYHKISKKKEHTTPWSLLLKIYPTMNLE